MEAYESPFQRAGKLLGERWYFEDFGFARVIGVKCIWANIFDITLRLPDRTEFIETRMV